MKNTGSDTPAVATTRQAWSMSESGLVAAKMPSGTAIAIETISPSSVSSAEAGSRVADLAGDRLAGGERVAEIAARQVADVARRTAHGSDLSRPSFTRICSIASLVAAGPAK